MNSAISRCRATRVHLFELSTQRDYIYYPSENNYERRERRLKVIATLVHANLSRGMTNQFSRK